MGKSIRKSRCWACKSLDVQGWGKRLGNQRFKCNNCGILFTSENIGVRKSNERVWFKKWVIERQTLSLLSRDSGISTRTLKRKFSEYLACYPRWVIPRERAVHLVLDGTYFKNKICLFLYLDNQVKEALLYRTTTGEYVEEIYEDLVNIMSVGIIIVSVTSDGHTSTLKAIKNANKWIKQQNKENKTEVQSILNQRCLVHIQRNCLTKLKQSPQSVAAYKLRGIAMTICQLNSEYKRDLFINAFNYWFEENREYITELSCSDKGKKRRKHKDLYSAYSGLKRALPSMFHYLDNDKIPSTTNSIEGYFSHLKSDINFHRGLSKEHFRNFLRWYVYFKRNR